MDSTNNYDHTKIEEHWKKTWEKSKLDHANIGESKPFDKSQDKPFYNLMMFPYPSAEGLHVGNMYAFTGSDIYGRYKRMQGFNVFEPIGLDGFGIHSENYALKIGKHPMDQAKISEKNFYRQLRQIGAMFDWSRTIETYDPGYYKWTQWLFVQMFKHGLAYRGKAEVNWCPSCKTVLADEQVIEALLPAPGGAATGGQGKCERCGNIVEKRLLEQWFFRITAYAEKLLENTNSLDWSEKVLIAQRNWIGKKNGITITYKVKESEDEVICFTTTPVNWAATFVALSPEHPLALKLAKTDRLRDVKLYIDTASKKTKTEGAEGGREKTGVFTGSYCINHVTGEAIPIWISDFVLMEFGSGAIQGCPGHDVRDFEFATQYKIPIKRVVVGPDGDTSPITKKEQIIEHGPGKMIDSDFLNGLPFEEAMKKTMDYFEEKGWGKRVVTYHLRDWLISRQRYWGPPIPMIFCEKCAKENKGERKDMSGWYAVQEDQLPVELPYIEDYKTGNDGVAPLAKHKEFYEVNCPGCGAKARRETDVSDTFLDSSWYFLRYPSVAVTGDEVAGQSDAYRGSSFARSVKVQTSSSPLVSSAQAVTELEKTRRAAQTSLPWDPEITRQWLPVGMYTGGAEHSVLHLMYSRFVWMCLRDWGYFDFSAKGGPASGWEEPFPHFYAHGLVIKEGAKMSKSKGNVVNPDEYIKLYGIDALRLYLMFMGPFDMGGDFRDSAMEGMSRWVGRVWRMAMASLQTPSEEVQKALHKLIKKVTEDTEKRRYNTAIASMMEFTNLATEMGSGQTALGVDELKSFILLLAPYAPHLAEELWERAGGEYSVHLQSWPNFDESKIVDEIVTIAVQIMGKTRDTIQIQNSKSLSRRQAGKIQKEAEALALTSERVQKHLEGKKVIKIIFVPGKIINFVV